MYFGWGFQENTKEAAEAGRKGQAAVTTDILTEVPVSLTLTIFKTNK